MKSTLRLRLPSPWYHILRKYGLQTETIFGGIFKQAAVMLGHMNPSDRNAQHWCCSIAADLPQSTSAQLPNCDLKLHDKSYNVLPMWRSLQEHYTYWISLLEISWSALNIKGLCLLKCYIYCANEMRFLIWTPTFVPATIINSYCSSNL